MLLTKARPVPQASSFEDDYASAIRVLTREVSREQAELLVRTGQYVQLMQELDWWEFVEVLNAAAERMYLRELTRTGQRALDEAVGVRKANELGLAFDATNPSVEAWAQRHAAELVTNVSRQIRSSVSAAVLEAVGGIAPARLAPLLLNTDIGLTRPWMQAVLTRAEQLGVGADDPRVQRYARQLLSARGKMIARTEVMRAQNAGRMAGWRQALDQNALNPATAKIWQTGPRPCPQCQGLSGETVRVTENFSTGDQMPPAHPHCTCTAVLESPSRAQEARGPNLTPAQEERIRQLTAQKLSRKQIIQQLRLEGVDVTEYRVYEVQRRLGILPGTPKVPPRPPTPAPPGVGRGLEQRVADMTRQGFSRKQIVTQLEREGFGRVTEYRVYAVQRSLNVLPGVPRGGPRLAPKPPITTAGRALKNTRIYLGGLKSEVRESITTGLKVLDQATAGMELRLPLKNVGVIANLPTRSVGGRIIKSNVMAWYKPGRYVMEFTNNLADAARGWNAGVEFFARKEYQSVVHEFAHYLDDVAPYSLRFRLSDIVREGVADLYSKYPYPAKRAIKSQISGYAVTNQAEYFAESFTKVVSTPVSQSPPWMIEYRKALQDAGFDFKPIAALLKGGGL